MTNLFFALQPDKQFKRQVALLQTLSAEMHPVTSKYLTTKLHISPPTLRHYVATLNSVLAEYIQIYSPRNGEFVLHFCSDLSIDAIITILAKETIVYKIVDSLLHDKKWTVQDAIIEGLISLSTLLRILHHMNAVLEPLHLSISAKTLELIGEEADIRAFFFAFYSSFGSSTILSPSAELETRRLINLICNLEMKRLHFSHFRIAIWLSIVQIRWHHKCFISLSTSAKRAVEKDPYFQNLCANKSAFCKHYQPPEDEMYWIHITALHCVSYSNDAFDKDNKSQHYHRMEASDVVVEIREFITEVMPSLIHDPHSSTRLEAFLVNTRLLSTFSSNFELTQPEMIEYMKQTSPNLFDQWLQQLERYHKKGSCLAFTHLEDIAACLTSLVLSTAELQRSKPLKVLFALQGSAGFDDYIKKISKPLFADHIQVDYLFERAVLSEKVKKSRADLIISNYDLQLSKSHFCPFLRLSHIPTLADWENVRRTLERLSSEETSSNESFPAETLRPHNWDIPDCKNPLTA